MESEETKPITINLGFWISSNNIDHLQMVGQGHSAAFRTGASCYGKPAHQAGFSYF